MKDEYRNSKSDLFAGFIDRCTDLAGPRGTVAMITMQSWMFLSSYEKLRASLLSNQRITSMLHLGARAFDSIGGEVVSSTAFVLANVPSEARSSARKRPGTFIRLVDGTSEADKVAALSVALEVRTKDAGFHLASDADFTAIPGTPIVYWLSEKMRATLAGVRTLATLSPPRQGLSTGDNNLFTRLWWEPSAKRVLLGATTSSEVQCSRAGWVPYNKGGEFRKWYGNQEYLVNWAEDGKAIRNLGRGAVRNTSTYFRASVSWTNVSSGAPAFRFYPEGFIASASTGDGVFPETPGDATFLAGVLNSSVSLALLAAVSPGLTFNVGTISELPLPESRSAESLLERIEYLVAGAKDDWDSCETSWNFERSPLVALA